MLIIGIRPVDGFGGEGHKIIALIANRLLHPQVQNIINHVLKEDEAYNSIVSASVWPDVYKRKIPWSAPLRIIYNIMGFNC
jgi:hypothetical protein